MKCINLLISLCILSIILHSCTTFKEAGDVMRNNKQKSVDEFFIEKKEPLSQPPDFTTIPEPGSTADKVDLKKNSFEKSLKKNKFKSSSNQTNSSTTEEYILNKIKK